jgi:hypothetical protein
MSNNPSDNFFNSIDYPSIIDTIKGLYSSDGTMGVLLDFERVLDEADLYAYKNWELGELVSGPDVKRYTVACMFMYPYKLMPDPRGSKRLLQVGVNIKYKKTTIKVPMEIDSPDDYKPGTHYPKMEDREIWLVRIEMPKELMDDIREGSIDLAGQTIDLDELDSAYDDDLQKEDTEGGEDQSQGQGQGQQMPPDMGMGGPPGMAPAPQAGGIM